MSEHPAEPIYARCAEFMARSGYARDLGYPGNPNMLRALGIYPYFIKVEETSGSEVLVRGRETLMFGSNNYLGMTTHPRVIRSAIEALERYGTGCTGSRLLNGTLELHEELERRLAAFVSKEAALVFSTGYQGNLAAISGLMRKGDVVVADKEVHASLIDGMRLARATSGVQCRYFSHNSGDALDRLLRSARRAKGKLVVVDGLYSMTGDLAPLPLLAEVCRKHDARLLVDDAHAIGVLGGGRGTAPHLGCADQIDLITGTFSKSFASCGGFLAGDAKVIHWVKHLARPFVFTASLPPANAATVLAVLDLLEESDQAARRVLAITEGMRHRLTEMGYEVGHSHGAIVPIIVGDKLRSVQAWRRFLDRGVYTNAVVPPAVTSARSGLRASFMATHTEEQLARGLSVFAALAEWVCNVRDRARSLQRPSTWETTGDQEDGGVGG